MKVILYESRTETVKKQVGYISTCNKCGKEVKVDHEKVCEWEDDIKGFSLSFGYESSFDGERWSFDLCEDCLVNIIKEFKYVPDGFKKDQYDNFTQEEHQKIFDYWKETGEWEDLKFKTYEELVGMNDGWVMTGYINEAIRKYHPEKPLLNDGGEEESNCCGKEMITNHYVKEGKGRIFGLTCLECGHSKWDE